MCKWFFYSMLVFLALGFSSGRTLNAQQNLYQSRDLQVQSALDEGLFHEVIHMIDKADSPLPEHLMDKNIAIGLLHTRYPELAHSLERLPKQTLNNKEIGRLMTEVLKTEVAAGVANSEDSFWHLTTQADLTTEDKATFQFLYAYELFRQKRFEEADKVFSRIAEARKGEFEYAYYYSGLIALMNSDYQHAEENLKHVGINQNLKRQTPFYLAASHYGQKDYHTVVNYYEPRIIETSLHNVAGLTKIVGYSQFKLEQFDNAIVTLNRLQKQRDLTDEEKYALGISYQRNGDRTKSTELLAGITIKENNLSGRAQYEKALNLAELGENQQAIAIFQQLLVDKSFDKTELTWNLCILHGRMENYDMVAHHAVQLLESPKQHKAIQLMAKLLDNIENEELFVQIATELSDKIENDDFVTNAIYNRATQALKTQDKKKAEQYFDLLVSLDPLTEERGVVAAWRGILAYEEENYSKAIRLLSNYEKSLPASHQLDKLDFDVAYFLAYSNFKLKNHSSALGQFSKALATHNKVNDKSASEFNQKENDIFLRLGDCYFLLDEHKRAKQAYTRIIDNNGALKDYALWQNSIIAELEGKPYDQVIILDELISDYPGSKYYHRALFSTANTLFALQRFDKASEIYNQLISNPSPQGMKDESMVQLGLINVNAGDYSKAETYFQKLIDNSNNQDIVSRSHAALKEIYTDYTYDTDAYIDLVASENSDISTESLAEELFQLGINNEEKGNKTEALSQWTKLVKDYPSYGNISSVYTKIASVHAQDQNWTKAVEAYEMASQNTSESSARQHLKSAEMIAFEKLKDYQKFSAIRKHRMNIGDSFQRSEEEIYQDVYASIELDEAVVPEDIQAVFATSEVTSKSKNELIQKYTSVNLKNKEYSSILSFYEVKEVKHIIDSQPKFIYQRGLVHFNAQQLENAEHAITDHYDALLEDPAWLAKGIILVADIYVLKDDKDSAEAALEALIASESKIPSSLITIAKERLTSLQLQN